MLFLQSRRKLESGLRRQQGVRIPDSGGLHAGAEAADRETHPAGDRSAQQGRDLCQPEFPGTELAGKSSVSRTMQGGPMRAQPSLDGMACRVSDGLRELTEIVEGRLRHQAFRDGVLIEIEAEDETAVPPQAA